MTKPKRKCLQCEGTEGVQYRGIDQADRRRKYWFCDCVFDFGTYYADGGYFMYDTIKIQL